MKILSKTSKQMHMTTLPNTLYPYVHLPWSFHKISIESWNEWGCSSAHRIKPVQIAFVHIKDQQPALIFLGAQKCMLPLLWALSYTECIYFWKSLHVTSKLGSAFLFTQMWPYEPHSISILIFTPKKLYGNCLSEADNLSLIPSVPAKRKECTTSPLTHVLNILNSLFLCGRTHQVKTISTCH